MKNVFIIHRYNGDTEYSFAPSVEKLSANKIFIKGAVHFNPKSNITEIEEINKIILGEYKMSDDE